MQHSREFLVLANTRSYSETAEMLHMTQSTLSRHIQRLEQDLGKPLFRRNTRMVELTEFGEWYCRYAQRIVEIEDECEDALQREQNLRVDHPHLSLRELRDATAE